MIQKYKIGARRNHMGELTAEVYPDPDGQLYRVLDLPQKLSVQMGNTTSQVYGDIPTIAFLKCRMEELQDLRAELAKTEARNIQQHLALTQSGNDNVGEECDSCT